MSNIPKLRFPEFNGEWEKKKLGDLAERVTTKNIEGVENVLTISAQFGLISQLEFFNKSVSAKDVSGYYLVSKNDFAYNKSYSNGYPMGAIKRLTRYEKGVVSTLYICFRNKNEFDNSFAEQYFETGKQNKEIEKVAQEGARNHGLLNIGVSEFFAIELTIPSLAEQARIASFFTTVDKKISQLKQKKALLEQYKKGVMQQLLVGSDELLVGSDELLVVSDELKVGSDELLVVSDELKVVNDELKVVNDELLVVSDEQLITKNLQLTTNNSQLKTKLRFKDENGNEFPKWEKKKLGDVAHFSKGKGISKLEISNEGKYDCIRYGELYTHYGETIFEIQSRTDIDGSELVFSEKNDVIIPASGESNIDIAKASCILKEGVAIGGDINIIRGEFDGVFLSYYLNHKMKNEIATLAQGVSVVHLYSNQLSSLIIQLPALKEQKLISKFITALDEKINRTESQLQKTEAWKKGLLQKMFC